MGGFALVSDSELGFIWSGAGYISNNKEIPFWNIPELSVLREYLRCQGFLKKAEEFEEEGETNFGVGVEKRFF